jgi:hypothetical protein
MSGTEGFHRFPKPFKLPLSLKWRGIPACACRFRGRACAPVFIINKWSVSHVVVAAVEKAILIGNSGDFALSDWDLGRQTGNRGRLRITEFEQETF